MENVSFDSGDSGVAMMSGIESIPPDSELESVYVHALYSASVT